MAVNENLEKAVLTETTRYLIENDPSFKILCDGEQEFGEGILKGLSKVLIDKDYKIRIHFSSIISYGYDFNEKSDEGSPSKTIYNKAVKNTKTYGSKPNMETLIGDKIIDNRFGWYLTRIG